MNIEELVNKYFEGETTCQEERELKELFSKGLVPGHLQVYRPLFLYMQEAGKLQQATEPPAKKKQRSPKRVAIYSLGALAAGFLIILAIAGINRHLNPLPPNYVMIDGKHHTDINLIRSQARQAFGEVCFSEEDVFDSLFEE